MPKIWPYETIRELLALADANGFSEAELTSEREAKLFRFAIYSFRTQNDIGKDLSITIEGTTVKIKKRYVPEVTIVHS